MRLFISIEKEEVDDLLKKVEEATDRTKILDEAGAFLLNRIRTRFLAEEDPDNKKWIPSRAAIRRRARGGTGTLFDTGRLFRSIQLSANGPNERQIGTDVPYAWRHQYGGRRNPQRKFLGFNQEDAELIEKLVIKRVKKALSEQ